MAESLKSWVIVSGAGGAIGSAVARRYAASGCTVLALDQDPPRLDALIGTPGLTAASVDLCDATNLERVLGSWAPRRQPIGLLVNAVGLIWNEPLLSLRGALFTAHATDSFERVIRANLTASFVCATRVAARMARTGGGVIVNFSSISAGGIAGQSAYAAAKAGIEGMTRAMAQELGPLGIRVNAIAPGFIDVATTREAVTENLLSGYAKRAPLGRLGTIEDLEQAIDSIATNAYLNGVVLALDGGLRL